jgi:hypothetical protein
MSLNKEVTDLFAQATNDPGSLPRVQGFEGGDPWVQALSRAVIRLAQEVDQLTERVDNLRARYGSG